MPGSCVPPGFRFHPTDEELVGYYLKRKISSLRIDLDLITDIDLYNMEPWEIQDRCKLLGNEEQKEWYFFSHKDKKYPTGTRTNRATAHGFWKATGRDKAVLSRNRSVIGMRKTLVFYRGRAPNGRKSDWIIHEYRFQTSEHAPPQEEGWVVCKAFKKPIPNDRLGGFEAYPHSMCAVQIRPQCNPDNVAPLIPDRDVYFQQSMMISTLPDDINNMEGLPQLLDTPPTAISSDSLPMKQVVLSQQRCNLPCFFEDYDPEGEWKTLSSLLTPPAPEPASSKYASHGLPALRAHELTDQNLQGYSPMVYFDPEL